MDIESLLADGFRAGQMTQQDLENEIDKYHALLDERAYEIEKDQEDE